MEVDESYGFIRSLMKNVEQSVGKELKYINSDNEDEINMFITKLAEHKLFNNGDVSYLRKIHFSFLINTNISVRDVLAEDHKCGHIVDIFPVLSTFVYFSLVDRLNLYQFLEETLSYVPAVFSVEILEFLEKQVKCLPYFSFSEAIRYILSGIYKSLCNPRNSVEYKFIKIKLSELFQTYALSFNLSKIPPQFSSLTSSQSSEFTGYRLLSLIHLLRDCALYHVSIPDTDLVSFYDIIIPFDYSRWSSSSDFHEGNWIIECYDALLEKCKSYLYDLDIDVYLTWHEVNYNDRTLQIAIREEAYYLLQCVTEKSLQSDLQNLFNNEFKSILSSIAMSPSDELDKIDMNDTNEIVQAISNKSEVSKKLLEILITKKDFDSDLLAINTVKSNISALEYELTELLITSTFDILYQNADHANKDILMETILLALKQLNLKDLLNLLQVIRFNCKVIDVLNTSPIDITSIIKRINDIKIDDTNDNFEIEKFIDVDQEISLVKDIAIHMVASPSTVFTELIKHTVREAATNSLITVQIIKTTKPLWSCLNSSDGKSTSDVSVLLKVLHQFLQNDLDELKFEEKESFYKLLFMFFKYDLIVKEDFLSHCLLPVLNVKENINWCKCTVWLRLLNDFIPVQLLVIGHGFAYSEIFIQRAFKNCCHSFSPSVSALSTSKPTAVMDFTMSDMLIKQKWRYIILTNEEINNVSIVPLLPDIVSMLSFLMDSSRWKMLTFDLDKVETLDECIVLVQRILQAELPSDVVKRLKVVPIDEFSEITRSYFWKFRGHEELVENSILFLMHNTSDNRGDFHDEQNRTTFALLLSKVLSVCSNRELYEIANNFICHNHELALYFLLVLQDSIMLLATYVLNRIYQNDHEVICQWFRYVFNTYIDLVQNVCMPLFITVDRAIIEKYMKQMMIMTTFCSILPHSVYFQFNVLKLLLELLQSDIFSLLRKSDIGELLTSLLILIEPS